MNLNNKSKGMTLLEVLTSLLALSAVVAFVALAIPTNAGLTSKTDKKETATALAQKYLEDVKKTYGESPTNFESLTSGTTPPITITTDYTANSLYSVTTNTTVDNTATFYAGQPNEMTAPCLATVTVTVTPANSSTSDTSQTVILSTKLRRDRL